MHGILIFGTKWCRIVPVSILQSSSSFLWLVDAKWIPLDSDLFLTFLTLHSNNHVCSCWWNE